MQLIISLLLGVMVLAIFFPAELIRKKNIYKAETSEDTGRVRESIDNKTAAILIQHAHKFSGVIKVRINDQQREKLKKQIYYAGLGNTLSEEDFIAVKTYMAILTTGFFGLMLLISYSTTNVLLMLIAIVMAFYVPNNWIQMRGRNRQWTIQKELPNILSSMAIITDAGMTLMQSLEVVTDQNEGVFCDELRKVLEDIKIGIDQKEAFIRLSQRTNVDEISYFVSAITQGIEKGNSGITKIIREQAKESWEKRKHKAKELAEKASMKLFLPLLLLVFPAFMIFLIGPMLFSVFKMFQ